MKSAAASVGALIAFAMLVVAISATVFGIRWITAEPKGKLQAREQILSGAYRIEAYDSFFNLCASIQGNEGAITAMMDALESAEADDRSRLRTNIVGLTSERARMIAQYNIDARKSYTRGQFRSSQLPYQLAATPYIKGDMTPCVG